MKETKKKKRKKKKKKERKKTQVLGKKQRKEKKTGPRKERNKEKKTQVLGKQVNSTDPTPLLLYCAMHEVNDKKSTHRIRSCISAGSKMIRIYL